ncbi:MAG TPA: hypothetical protein VKU38_09670 [Ktedonobacteraceae bacterium]|nr:hypothetical protein [Ktedonobacteraceae bacterium]
MSNFHTNGSSSSRDSFSTSTNGTNGTSGNNGSNGNSSSNNSFVSRRDIRASNPTGALPVVGAGRGYSSYTGHTGSFDFEAMLISLHELFEQDRQIASSQDARRCGICYLHFVVSELHYREEEGLYVCQGCEKAASKLQLPMLRRQQK